MATKKGMIDKAMASKPMAAVKGLIGSAVDAFTDPPMAPGLPAPAPMRRATKKAPAKKIASPKAFHAKKPTKMDSKLVSTMELYEVKYLAQKWKVTQKAVKEAVAKVGHSRNKVEAELKRGKL